MSDGHEKGASKTRIVMLGLGVLAVYLVLLALMDAVT